MIHTTVKVSLRFIRDVQDPKHDYSRQNLRGYDAIK